MAEALGLAANIAAVLQLAAQVAQLSYSYACDVKNAPKTQKEYLKEVSALMEVLFRVEQAIAETESAGLLPPRPPSLDDNAIMEFYKELSALQFELQKRRSRFLRPFHDRELRPHIDMLHKFRSLLSDFLSSCILSTTLTTYNEVSNISQEQERDLLLSWIPSKTFPGMQKPIPCPGTGEWFLATETAQDWIHQSTRFVWCYGPPGVGKSYLASVMIDHLLTKQRARQDFLTIYFFCDFSSQDHHTTLDILHCLLRQLIEQGGKEILNSLKDLCKDPSIFQSTQQLAHLISMAASVQSIYLVFDAADEMKDASEMLNQISSFANSGIQVLMTSRDLPQIRKKVAGADNMEISTDANDLKIYVKSRLSESDFADDAASGSILIDDVVSQTGDLFLLARLLLDEVLDLTTVGQVNAVLQRGPQSLQQAFETTFTRIDAQSKARSSLARRVLGWIVFAKRRLSLEEVLDAFAVDDEEIRSYNMPSHDMLVRVCVGLVAIRSHDNTIRLVHTSAHDFLRELFLEQDVQLNIARTCLQYISLKALMPGACDSPGELLERFQKLPFLEYSAKYWGHHIYGKDSERKLEPQIMKLLRDENLRGSAFQALQFRQEYTSGLFADEMFHSLPRFQSELHIAAYWNLTEITRRLLHAGANPSAADSHDWTPLHWACSKSHLAAAELLVRSGAIVNAQDIQGWTPLFWACFIGSIDVVRLLLANGADHLIRSSLGWTALHWAISCGHSAVVQTILEHHAQCQPIEPALHKMTWKEIERYFDSVLPVRLAAEGQDIDIFGLLVQHIQTPDGKVGDANFNMIWAREKFDYPISNNPWRTMTKGICFNEPRVETPEFDQEQREALPKKWKSTLLLSAIRDKQLESVCLLLKAGADPDYENALHLAAWRQDPRYVQYLLQHGADPAAVNRSGGTALHEAVSNGFLDTTAAIIEGGANVNQSIQSSSGRVADIALPKSWVGISKKGITPLMQAVISMLSLHSTSSSTYKTFINIFELLLSKGADPGIKDVSNKTALHYGLLRPRLRIVKRLIESGAKVDEKDQDGCIPLHYLARFQQSKNETRDLEEVVLLLLENSQNKETLTQPIHKLVPVADHDLNDNRKLKARRRSKKLWRPLWQESDEVLAPMALALRNKNWKVARIFTAQGVGIPTDLSLDSILNEAISDMEMEIIDMLLAHGARPSMSAVCTLVSSFAESRSEKEVPEDHAYVKFKKILSRVISAGGDVNSRRTGSGEVTESPMCLAASVPGSRKILQGLLSFNADPFTSSSQTFDPILTAAIFGEIEDFDCLLNYAAVNPNPDHWSSHLQVVSAIIDPMMRLCLCLQRADALNCTNQDGRTLLHLAAKQGNVPLINSLVSCNAQLDIADSDGWLAVHCAGFALQAAALQILLPLSKNVFSNTNSASHPELASYDTSAILRKTDRNGDDILQVALDEKNLHVVKLLVEHGVDPDTLVSGRFKRLFKAEKRPIIFYVIQFALSELVLFLIEKGADIEHSDGGGWRPIHLACHEGRADIVKALIEAGADVHAWTATWSDGYSGPLGLNSGDIWVAQPLHLAALGGNRFIVQMLFEKDVNIHAVTGPDKDGLYSSQAYGATALHIALSRADLGWDKDWQHIAQWLVDRGAMVQGVIPRFLLKHILKFKGFSELWDALVRGERGDCGQEISQSQRAQTSLLREA